MNTKSVAGVVLAFGVAFAMIGGSGIGGAVFGVEDPSDRKTAQTLEDVAEVAEPSEDSEGNPLSGDAAGDNEPTTIGFVLSAGGFVTSIVGAVAFLPFTLQRLGFPLYFSIPVGGVAQIIATIGAIQFVTGREYD